MATISVCMIVKNEEAVLERCLRSLSDIPDELIIADTGSTDATVAIAEQFTPHIYHFPWVNDFAAARNFTLQKAGMEYIYMADADEVLEAEDLQRFRLLKAALLEDVELVEMAYVTPTALSATENFTVEYRPKLFKRLRTFQYTDPIHEVLRTEPIVFRSDVAVQHYPTGGHGARDIAALAAVAERGPLSDRLEMMYARELLLAGTEPAYTAAEQYFQAVPARPGATPAACRRAACVLAHIAANRRDAAMLLRAAAPELVGIPPCELCCALGQYHLALGEAALARDWYHAALHGAEPELVAASAGSWPLNGLAACADLLGNTEEAGRYRADAAAWRPETLKGE